MASNKNLVGMDLEPLLIYLSNHNWCERAHEHQQFSIKGKDRKERKKKMSSYISKTCWKATWELLGTDAENNTEQTLMKHPIQYSLIPYETNPCNCVLEAKIGHSWVTIFMNMATPS